MGCHYLLPSVATASFGWGVAEYYAEGASPRTNCSTVLLRAGSRRVYAGGQVQPILTTRLFVSQKFSPTLGSRSTSSAAVQLAEAMYGLCLEELFSNAVDSWTAYDGRQPRLLHRGGRSGGLE